MDINTTGAFILAQAAARRMVEQRTGGSITFISSISAHRVNFPQPQAGYNVSKAALFDAKELSGGGVGAVRYPDEHH